MTESKPVSLVRKLAIGVAATALGLAVGYGVALVAPRSAGHRWSDALSLGVAGGLLFIGLMLVAAGLSEPAARRIARTDKPSKKMMRQYFRQGVTTLLAGVMMAIPPLILGNEGIDDLRSAVVMTTIAIMFAAQTWLNFDLWRTADEFFRRAMLETSALSFWVLQGALFLWAVAERTGYVPPLQSWDAVAVLMAVYMGLSILVARKLGVE